MPPTARVPPCQEADDFEDEDSAGFLMPPEGGGGSPGGGGPPHLAPPPKRTKVEARQAPKISTTDPALLAKLQSIFALRAAPPDAADKLHRAIDDRLHSWAFGDERSLTYLLACFGRLGHAEPDAATAIKEAKTTQDIAAAEARASRPATHLSRTHLSRTHLSSMGTVPLPHRSCPPLPAPSVGCSASCPAGCPTGCLTVDESL